jgi:hypothetical protein
MSQATTQHQQASGHQIRNLKELEHDPYHAKKKLAEPTVCRQCGAIYQDGRWQWGEAVAGAEEATCPACQRIEDHCPAGFLTLGGDFLAQHKDEILHLIHNLEAREKSEHALKRVMAIEEQADGSLLATFTDPHLARAAGEAVHDACKGELDYHYQPGEFLLRVTWKR